MLRALFDYIPSELSPNDDIVCVDEGRSREFEREVERSREVERVRERGREVERSRVSE